jgi:tetratricopeptide (TPR) repeat protein
MPLKPASFNTISEAGNAEKEGDLSLAAQLYEQAIKENSTDEFAYTRLMIVYRKLKQYKDELRIINKGIKSFKEAFNKRIKHSVRKNSTVSKLSTALMKSSGLLDKKGNAVYEPQPIESWKKRKQIVEKKIKR